MKNLNSDYINKLQLLSNDEFKKVVEEDYFDENSLIENEYLIGRYFFNNTIFKSKFSILLNNGLDIFKEDCNSSIFLTLCSKRKYLDFLKLALSNINCINNKNQLFIALKMLLLYDNITAIKLLLSKIKNYSLKDVYDSSGCNILHIAILENKIKLMKMFFLFENKLCYQKNKNGITPISLSIISINNDFLHYIGLNGVNFFKDSCVLRNAFLFKNVFILKYMSKNLVFSDFNKFDINEYVICCLKEPKTQYFQTLPTYQKINNKAYIIEYICLEIKQQMPGLLEYFLNNKIYKKYHYPECLKMYYEYYKILEENLMVQDIVLIILNYINLYKNFVSKFNLQLLKAKVKFLDIRKKKLLLENLNYYDKICYKELNIKNLN